MSAKLKPERFLGGPAGDSSTVQLNFSTQKTTRALQLTSQPFLTTVLFEHGPSSVRHVAKCVPPASSSQPLGSRRPGRPQKLLGMHLYREIPSTCLKPASCCRLPSYTALAIITSFLSPIAVKKCQAKGSKAAADHHNC